jgi:hypothetical protein
MIARLATFEGRDPAHTDELVEAVRARVGSGDGLAGARRVLLLVDRVAGADLGVVLFESSEAMRAAEPTLERLGDEIPEALRGRRASVHVYEVAIDSVADGGRAARVTRFEGSPDQLDDGVLFINEYVVPEVTELTGWRGLLVLVDRGTGSVRTISFWDGPESLAATAERAEGFGRQVAEALGESFAGFTEYEVALHAAPVVA